MQNNFCVQHCLLEPWRGIVNALGPSAISASEPLEEIAFGPRGILEDSRWLFPCGRLGGLWAIAKSASMTLSP